MNKNFLRKLCKNLDEAEIRLNEFHEDSECKAYPEGMYDLCKQYDDKIEEGLKREVQQADDLLSIYLLSTKECTR